MPRASTSPARLVGRPDATAGSQKEGPPLLVNTGDAALDTELAGYRRVATGYNEDLVARVASEA